MTERTGGRGARVASFAIAAVIIAVVAMLVVPLPGAVIDAVVVANLGAAVALVMAAVFAPRPTRFASFPTLLVVTTLVRVGIEVSVTRRILGDGDPGDVVRAFGDAVVAQSVVVGVVVFAVITIVQLVVVARGAERVAEVAARFALDAMPGKQLAIDADLRAGAIDAATARARRDDLERESQLYGAMDGAMRFVKGDAIAALAIVAINLVAGMAIGVGQRGMSAAEAAHTFTLLSIGEGLAAQIPSLLVAVASGLLVTRVASAGDRALGDDLADQLAASPRVLAGAAALLVALAAAPGLPPLPFATLAAVAAAGAFAAARARARAAAAQAAVAELGEPGALAASPRLTLRVSAKLAATLTARHGLVEALAAARTAARAAVALPPIAVEVDARLADAELAVAIGATPAAYLALAAAELVEPTAALRARLPAVLAELAPELITIDRTAALVEAAAQHAGRGARGRAARGVARDARRRAAPARARARPARRPRRDPRGDRARARGRRRSGAGRAPARPAAPADHRPARAPRRARRPHRRRDDRGRATDVGRPHRRDAGARARARARAGHRRGGARGAARGHPRQRRRPPPSAQPARA